MRWRGSMGHESDVGVGGACHHVACRVTWLCMLVAPLRIVCAQVFSGTTRQRCCLVCSDCGCWSGVGGGGRGGCQWGRVGGGAGALDWGQGGWSGPGVMVLFVVVKNELSTLLVYTHEKSPQVRLSLNLKIEGSLFLFCTKLTWHKTCLSCVATKFSTEFGYDTKPTNTVCQELPFPKIDMTQNLP